jgi:hypothetical protein
MATINTSQFTLNQPEAVHVGDNVLICRVSISLSISVGDVHRIGKLPHGAIPLDAIFYGTTNAGQGIYKFGTSASQELFFASLTYSAAAVQRCTRRLGYGMQVSLSDDVMPRYDAVTMVGTTNTVTGYIGDLIIFYKMPGQSGGL